MLIPEDKIAQVRESVNIVDLVSGYLSLRPRGRNHFGLCPFHHEKTPSFSVNPELQIYHCFGCGAGGNAISFIMNMEGLGFVDAVKQLAQRAGIELDLQPEDRAVSQEKESLYHVNGFAAQFFVECLRDEKTGAVARKYLESRRIPMRIVDQFGLGYAPNEWDALQKKAQAELINESVLEQAGLIIPRKQGDGHYDRFRGRLMVPIYNLMGRVVAFGGRQLTEDADSPKYINSPETAIYQKGTMLFGLYQNRDAVRKEDSAILVEGYTDLLRMTEFEFANVVASLGTAFTEEQARLIGRYTKKVTVLYDNDLAGQKAAMRAGDILTAQGFAVRIALLPEGHDPDSFLREKGREALSGFLDQAPEYIQFKLGLFHDKSLSPQKKTELLKSVLATVSGVPDSIQRSMLLKNMAEEYDLDERALAREVEKQLARKRWRAQPGSGSTGTARMVSARHQRAEIELLRLMIRHNEVVNLVFEHVSVDDFETADYRDVVAYLYECHVEGHPPGQSRLVDMMRTPEVGRMLAGIWEAKKDPYAKVDVTDYAGDCVAAIRTRDLQRRLEAIQKELRTAGLPADRQAELLSEVKDLQESIRWYNQKTFLQ